MNRISAWISSMWMANDADRNSDVVVSVTLSAEDARWLALGNAVTLGPPEGIAAWLPDHPSNFERYGKAARNAAPGDLASPSPASQPAPAEIPRVEFHPDGMPWFPTEQERERVSKACAMVRPEVPPFDGSLNREVGIACNRGLTYKYAYPVGATPADACRWSHVDETEVREELWDIQPGDVVYDIGSAFGSYALSALAAGAAHVVCFNPNPQEQGLLMASARLNGWADKITLRHVGLWSESGYLNDEEQTFTKSSGDFTVSKTTDGRHTQLFEVRSLDSLDLPVRDGRAVLKCDIEGAEAHMLKGARVFFAHHQPAFVLIEVHIFKDTSLEQQTDAAMADLGYVPVTKRPYHSVMHALYRMKGWDD